MATDPLIKRLLRNALNAWCATGKGGGKDNSCSPNGGGGLKFGSPAFQKWFSGSKVVDRDGNPLVVFHGTTKDFDSFQTDLPKDKDWGMLDRALGAHFAEDPSVTDTFTIGQYVWPGTDSVSDRPGESFYRDTNGELRYDGIPVVIMQDENGKETVTPYDPKIHGGTWGIADRLGHSAYLRVLPPGGRVLPVFLSIRNPLHVEPIGRESDQSAVSRVVGALAFGHDRDLFVSAMSSTGRGEETAGKIWDLLSQGKEYDGGPYEKYKSFEDVSKNFPGMLNGRENAERAKSILRDLGYDGILYTNTSDNEVKGDASRRTWIAFDVGQIKSAIGNRGTFDPTDKNIRNAFCPTGKGGGKDNSCPPQRQSSGIDEVEVFGRPVRLYRNPSEQQLKALFEKYPGDRFGDSVRGIVDFTTGDMYAWKGSEAPHFGVEDVLGGLDRWWEFHNADEGDNAVTLKKALSEWKAIKNDLTNNAWCATGKGGGKDNSCPPTGEGGRSKSKAKKAKSSGLMMVEVKEYDPMDDDPYRDADLIKVRVYRNPTFDEAKAIKTKDNELRGLFDGETGNYYLWDSAKAYHEDMAEGLGIDYENTDQELWYLGIKEEVDHLKRVVTKWRRMGNQVGNAWCPTGEGGGKDNSCSPNRSDVPKFDVNGTYPVYHVTSDVYLPSILQRGLGSPDLKNHNPTQKQTPLLSHGVVSWTRDPAYAINEGEVRLVISDKQKLHHAGFLTEESVAMLATDATGDTLEPGVNEFEEITQGIVPSKLIDRIEMPNSLYVKMQKDLGNYKRWSNDAAEEQKTVEIGSRKYKMLGLRHESYKQSYQELKQILDDPRLHVGNFYRRDWKSGEVLTDNAWCPTGEGGGKDNSCPPHNAGTAVASVHDASKKIKFSDALVSDKLITRDTPDLIIKTLTPAETKEFNDKLQKEYEKRRAELKGDLTDGEFNYKHGDRIRGMIKKEMTQKMFDEHPDWFMATVRPNQMRDEMWYSIGHDRDQVSIRTDSGAKFQVKSNASTFKSESMKKPGISYSVDPATQAEKISKKDFDQLYAKVTPSIIAHVERYKPEVVTLAAKTAAKKELYNDIAKTITETHPQYFAAYQDVENNIRFYTVGLKSMQQEIMDSVPKHAGWTSKMRVLNAWCPTGKGGGKDNSCSPNGGGRSIDSPEFKEWFGESKVVDENGKPLRVYHGTNAAFDDFSYDFLGSNGTAEGYGFYFTSSADIASGYADKEEGNVKPAYISIQKPLDLRSQNITPAQLAKFIKKLDPNGDGYLSNWGDVASEGYDNVLRLAVRAEMRGADNDVDLIHSVINADGGASVEKFETLRSSIGYDGIIDRTPEWGGDHIIVIPFQPSQIKSAITFNAWIVNVKTSGKYSSTQVNILEPLASQILEWTRANVPQEWHADDGIEDQPHITVKYGLHTDNADDVRRVIEDQPPIHARIGQLSVFEVQNTADQRGGAKYDVLKFEILSDDLQRINKIINDSLPHTDSHPIYNPHMTLVYLKPGFGRQFIGKDNPFTGMDLVFDEVNYSNKQQVHTPIDLVGTAIFN